MRKLFKCLSHGQLYVATSREGNLIGFSMTAKGNLGKRGLAEKLVCTEILER